MYPSLKPTPTRSLLASAALALSVTTPSLAATTKKGEAAPYTKVSGVSGSLNSIGSDSLNNLMTFWAEDFKKIYPNVSVQVEGKGSSTAPPALIEGTAQLGPMSREMKTSEIEAFEKKHGFKPTQIAVALDCLAVFVHRNNPLKGLTMQQVDAIFSKTRKAGSGSDIATWAGAGAAGTLAAKPISIYGRNSASGTYGFFKDEALLKGDYKDTVKEQPGSASVVSGVAGDESAIGYSGIGYMTSGVRPLALSAKDGAGFVEPSFENALNGTYPLGRSLYVYVARKPGEPMAKSTREFLKYVLSKAGQATVVKDGYGALPTDIIQEQLKKLE